MEVEDEVELADVAEVAVKALHKVVNYFQTKKLIVILVDSKHEV